jgi:phage shock protein C
MGKRHRKHRSHRRGAGYSNYRSKKKSGWGLNLYRNTRDGKIGGVAAGLADHWDVAHWVVRLIWVGGFLFTGTLALWAYVAAWILLAPQPYRRSSDRQEAYDEDDEPVAEAPRGPDMEYDEHRHGYRPRKVFRYTEGSSVRLKRARERLDGALRRVEDMESYVTSRQYDLNKEFSKL